VVVLEINKYHANSLISFLSTTGCSMEDIYVVFQIIKHGTMGCPEQNAGTTMILGSETTRD
jgi:hypothetical protein